MDRHIKVMDNVNFFCRDTAEGYKEVRCVGLVNTLAAIQYMIDNGYKMRLEPKDPTTWPVDRRPFIFYMEEVEEGSCTLDKEVEEVVQDETPELPSTEREEEEGSSENGEKEADETSDDSEVKQGSEVDASGTEGTAPELKVSPEELLDGPNWSSISAMSKQVLEDEAYRWGIQLDTSNTKKVMLENFKASWEAKTQA